MTLENTVHRRCRKPKEDNKKLQPRSENVEFEEWHVKTKNEEMMFIISKAFLTTTTSDPHEREAEQVIKEWPAAWSWLLAASLKTTGKHARAAVEQTISKDNVAARHLQVGCLSVRPGNWLKRWLEDVWISIETMAPYNLSARWLDSLKIRWR